MKVIIVGGGRTGMKLAERLLNTGHEPTIVEEGEKRAQTLASELDALVIHGSGSNLDVLKDANAEKTDVLAAVTGSDEVNFMACKLAKEAGVPRVITRVNDSQQADMFKDVGADVTISPIDASIILFERAITGPGVYGMLSWGGSEADVIEVPVDEGSEAAGKLIEELDLPGLCTISLITRDSELVLPRGKTQFEEGDRVILAGKSEDVISAAEMFRKEG